MRSRDGIGDGGEVGERARELESLRKMGAEIPITGTLLRQSLRRSVKAGWACAAWEGTAAVKQRCRVSRGGRASESVKKRTAMDCDIRCIEVISGF